MRNLDQYLPGGDVRNPGVYSPQDQTNKGKLATSFGASNFPNPLNHYTNHGILLVRKNNVTEKIFSDRFCKSTDLLI